MRAGVKIGIKGVVSVGVSIGRGRGAGAGENVVADPRRT